MRLEVVNMSNDIVVCEDMNQLMPFGKYKGQPVSVLAGDPSYCDWIMGQDGIKQKWPVVYNLIVNNFTRSEDTPEHNRLQAQFLDRNFVEKFLYHVSRYIWPSRADCYRRVQMDFEFRGWDVYFYVSDDIYRIKDNAIVDYTHSQRIFVELKPSVGDDFPTIMREMRTHSRISYQERTYNGGYTTVTDTLNPNDCWLVYDRYNASSVTETQMRKMFEVNGFHVVSLTEIEDVCVAIDPAGGWGQLRMNV